MSEAEFIARVCDGADCGLMLDVNNAFVNATNFGFDVDEWMRTVPLDRVVQMHIAGHDWFTEDGEPLPSASTLGEREAGGGAHRRYARRRRPRSGPRALRPDRRLKTGPVPVVLERDQDHIPLLEVLLEEVAKIARVMDVTSLATRDDGA